MQIELMQHQHPRNLHRKIVDVHMEGVVPHLVKDNVVAAYAVVRLKLAPVANPHVLRDGIVRRFVVLDEDVQPFYPRRQMRQERLAVVRNSRRLWIQRREKGDSHSSSAVNTAKGEGTRIRTGTRSASVEIHSSMVIS